MGEKKYTPEQCSAIDTRDKTLLVSAAAGSGKTATLTERIIQSLIDEKNPGDISKMLIVTFTNAAVAELRDRITAAIKSTLLLRPDDKRLEKQLFMLPGARISTIDSFCNDIFKNNAEHFGISPKYRIADPIEAAILSHSVLSSLIEAMYNDELSDVGTSEEFIALADALTGVKTENTLEDVLTKLYNDAENLEEGVGIFARFADELYELSEKPLEENRYARHAIGLLKSAASHYLGVYEKLIPSLSLTDGEEKYAALLEKEKKIFDTILCESDYDGLRAALKMPFERAPSVKDENKTEGIYTAISVRDDLKATLASLYDSYFFASREEWRENSHALGASLALLGRFLKKFHSVYFEEKRSHAMLEYSDIERLAYMSLYENGELTEYALSLKEQFEAVYIDEYQDVNRLQNRIFEAVSKDDNRFMVGDIKQSIYGFRSAAPEIFADMKSKFPILAQAKNSPTASIFMSKNFRCDRGVVDFVNGIFDVMFELTKESIGYVEADRLGFGKDALGEEPPYSEPEIKIFTKEDLVDPDTVDDDEAEEVLSDIPPKYIANKIKELIGSAKLDSGEPVRPSHIAIILRRDGGRVKKYADALGELGIRVEIPTDGTFFLNAEIQLVLCLLNAIDNPRRDIYLAGLMCSPLYDFSPDEMYLIKKIGEGGTLYESLVNYCEKTPEFVKGRSFIQTLGRYRALAEGVMVDSLIMRLYNETGMLALASRSGGKENLMLLYSYARAFEGSSYNGLHSFINYINTVISSGAKFSPKKSSASEDAVTIITVHKSKGLEYPIVFLGDAGGSLLSKQLCKERVAYSDSFGIAMKLRMQGGIALVDSPIYNTVRDYNAARAREEELRVYYVALTRAREKLYVVGHTQDKSADDLRAKIAIERLYKSPYTVNRMRSILDIILTSTDVGRVEIGIAEKVAASTDENASEKKEEKATLTESEARELISELAKRFKYEYPNKHLTTLPEKLSISVLYPTVLDGVDEEVTLTADTEEKKAPDRRATLPEFISGTNADESAKRGIATHTFLQFCDLGNLAESGARAELDRLTKEGFISKENAARVRIREIETFKKSALLAEMMGAEKILREFRFNVKLPARLFTTDNEKRIAFGEREILLQGVIDCLIEDKDGNLHLIDYKTDRLTKEELEDKALAEKTLAEKHSLQLSYYSEAIKKIFGKEPITKRVYSLPLGDTVNV